MFALFMNRALVFHAVWNHFVVNNQPRSLSADGGACRYRGANGAKCAVGVLISDEEYESCMEGSSVLYNDSLPYRLKVDQAFLQALQNVHDMASNDSMAKNLREFAHEWKLPVPGESPYPT